MKATCIVMFLFLLSPSLFSGLADSSHFKGFDAEDEPLGVNSLHRLTDLPHLNKPTTTRLSDPQPQTPDDLPHLNKPTTTRLSDPQPQTPDDLPHLNKPTTTRLSDTQPETPEPKSDANPDPKPTRQPNPISKKPSSYLIEFATKDSIFEKNFSLPGVGGGEDSPLLLKDGQNVFKFYSSGRRFCSVLPATMELVYMNGDTMGHVVFASAMKKAAKGMQKETRDLNRLAEMVPAPTGSSRWAVDELGVIKEV